MHTHWPVFVNRHLIIIPMIKLSSVLIVSKILYVMTTQVQRFYSNQVWFAKRNYPQNFASISSTLGHLIHTICLQWYPFNLPSHLYRSLSNNGWTHLVIALQELFSSWCFRPSVFISPFWCMSQWLLNCIIINFQDAASVVMFSLLLDHHPFIYF